MSNLADRIERYIKELLMQSDECSVELQRQQIASLFGCVPSQINYVLATRFALENGYVVESRRGGGGYLRIMKLTLDDDAALWDFLSTHLGEVITEAQARGMIQHLMNEGLLSVRESMLMAAAMQRDVLQGGTVQRDALRARLLKAMLFTLFRQDCCPKAPEGERGHE
ncbi:CtsR family transcriptional regulator [Heliophilum fasciatum]|uniref:Transcriptional regulator CtsR n=1 Tax=Heliophilum fasciatum TaxID=35700 RepID=A0A4R2RXD3_9FIRM|nr:CtsR family transcriptional regulator [Heliophilum fasciatum]MCW2277857.1 transcriptional regulator CtsR [Heliophilum fasciatum]TCP64651.1 transcriptional regulator [Heliophilum fasciatum]